jgi:hypothetical protein
MRWSQREETTGLRERAYARSILMGLVTRARREGRVKESQRWGRRSVACAVTAWRPRGRGRRGCRRCGGETGGGEGGGGQVMESAM